MKIIVFLLIKKYQVKSYYYKLFKAIFKYEVETMPAKKTTNSFDDED